MGSDQHIIRQFMLENWLITTVGAVLGVILTVLFSLAAFDETDPDYCLACMYFRFRLMAKALRPIRRNPIMISPNALARLSWKK